MRIMKKCPPGVLCIENMTLAFLVLALFLILYFIYSIIKAPVSTNNNIKLDNHITEKVVLPPLPPVRRGGGGFGFGFLPSYPYNNLQNSLS